jgi:hypothetical protein
VTVDRAQLAARIDRERDLAARGVKRESAAQTPVSRSTDELDRRLLAALAAHEGPAGICPRVPRLAALLTVSESTLHRALRRLVDAGQLERLPVFECDDDPEWRRRGHQPSHPRRQTSNSYRLLVTPGSATLNPGSRLTPGPGVTASEEPAAQTPVSQNFVTPLEGKEGAGGGYQRIDEDESALSPAESIEIAIEPPAALQLDHDPSLTEVLATLGRAFGPVQVLTGPATYRTARGRLIDLAASPASDLHQAVDQLQRHTCRRRNGGAERCVPGRPCGRHARRARPA